MQSKESNLDANLIIQSFQERINQLTTEVVVKDATIKQLTLVIEELKKATKSTKKEEQ
jgi:hypothetical protein